MAIHEECGVFGILSRKREKKERERTYEQDLP